MDDAGVTDEVIDAAEALLLGAGATAAEVARCGRDIDALVDLSIDVGLREPGALEPLRTVADRAGIEVASAQAALRAAGLAADDPELATWFASDARWLAAFDAGREVFGDDGLLALLRRAGAAAEQLAHASAGMFRIRTSETVDRATRPLDAIERNLAVAELVGQYLDGFAHLYRHHSRRALRPDSVAAGRLGELRDLCVGFVDVASSTALAETLDAAELAELVWTFEQAAFDAAFTHGVRVVKTIGDEVMLCGDRSTDVCGAALHLVAWCSAHPTLAAARGGVARGPLLDQGGDCYGPVVNRAARFAQAADDGVVMVDEAVAAEVAAAARGAEPALVAQPRVAVDHRGLGTVAWWEVARPLA